MFIEKTIFSLSLILFFFFLKVISIFPCSQPDTCQFLLGGKMCTLNGEDSRAAPSHRPLFYSGFTRGDVGIFSWWKNVYPEWQRQPSCTFINRFPIRDLHVATRVSPCTLASVLGAAHQSPVTSRNGLQFIM